MNIFNKISNMFFPKIIPEPETELSHIDILQEKMKIIANTDKFPKFMYWIINDLSYGMVIGSSNKSLSTYLELTSLYQNWIDTGIKPPGYEWASIKAKCDGNIYGYDLIDCAEDVENAYINIDSFCFYIQTHSNFTKETIQNIRINKLDELINEIYKDKLYTWEDYETP